MRKLTITSLALIVFSFASHAQISKGSLFLGGSFGAYANSSKDDTPPNYETKSTGFSIFPQIGKAVGENKVVGFSLGYSQGKNESNFNGLQQQNKNYSVGIFYRRYYPLSTRFYLFGQGVLDCALVKSNRENNNVPQQTTNTTSIGFSITPGISYAASRKLHLEASLNQLATVGYSFGKNKNYNTNGTVSGTSTQKSFGLTGNGNGFSSLTIGLRWILPSKS